MVGGDRPPKDSNDASLGREPQRILSKTKLKLRPMKTLEVCLELHEKAIDNADEVTHGT